jgi:hypothetical protein
VAHDKEPTGSNGPRASDRRATPRLTPTVTLAAIDADTGEPVSVINISEGGLLIQTRNEAEVGDARTLHIRIGSASGSLTLPARVAHVMGVTYDGNPGYLIGLAFLPSMDAEQRDAIVGILEQSGR